MLLKSQLATVKLTTRENWSPFDDTRNISITNVFLITNIIRAATKHATVEKRKWSTNHECSPRFGKIVKPNFWTFVWQLYEHVIWTKSRLKSKFMTSVYVKVAKLASTWNCTSVSWNSKWPSRKHYLIDFNNLFTEVLFSSKQLCFPSFSCILKCKKRNPIQMQEQSHMKIELQAT